MKPRLQTPGDAVYQQAGERIVFRFRPGWAVPFAEVRGDLVHWQEGLEMTPASDGWWEASTRVPAGTYSYKFVAGGSAWQLDLANPRTRATDGNRNSLLVVGGTDEPIMHAPAPPYLHLLDSGELCVRAGLRRGAVDMLRLCWDEGHGMRSAPMALVAEEDDHLLLEACLPVSARAVEYLFQLPDGRLLGRAGGPGQAFHLETASLHRSAPAWWKDAVIYSILVDRFRRGDAEGFWTPEQEAIRDGSLAGGDLSGIVEALPHLVDLGITALHLTPIVLARSSHRYDGVDLRTVDPALGGEPALQRLLDEALAVGIRVLLDVSITHVHRDFFAFRDVRDHGQASPYWEWFYPRHHPFQEGLVPGYLHYRKGAWQQPLLRLDHPEVADYLTSTFEHWARAGADGFRIDAAADVPLDLLRRITRAVRSVRPDAAVFGEVVTDNIHRWNSGAVDSVTDFPSQEILYDWVWRKRLGACAAGAAWSRRRFWRGGPGWSAITFVGTHDQHRLRTLTKDARATRLGLLAVLMRPEVPLLYYGDEAGLHASEAGRNFEDTWPDRQCMPWDRSKWDQDTWNLVREALLIRASSTALRRGDERYLPVEPVGASADDVLAMRRTWGESVVDVILHRGEGDCTVSLPTNAPSCGRLLLSTGSAAVNPAQGLITLGPWSAAVIERIPPPDTALAWNRAVEDNRRASAAAFRSGAVEWVGLPSHLYLTVTESCNLRCRHCINHSPSLTCAGTARQMQPWLLDRLQDAFAAADYFAFTHGGESLTSAMLPEVLRAIQAARASHPRRYDVHLLTNGMLLSSDKLRSLIDLGVTSIGVSLDGARAETTERLRLGSSHPMVIKNLRHAVRMRAQADLRVGISMVVSASNLPELADMASLALDLGVDWLKLEEMFPSSAVARQELVAPSDPRLAEAMATVRRVVAGSRLVLVDHLSPPSGCECEARDRPDLREFRRADDFANRAHFQPCRAAWQQACVDPDGSVHPVDYHHPAIGNLLHDTMLDLWHNGAMHALRREAIARIASPLREACPIEEQLNRIDAEAGGHGR
ncbi:MAG: radical SAM protein [Deltaproteobacteria bacterium]|nr:radical SAM protein [Deltaproteobacteria bacterium]